MKKTPRRYIVCFDINKGCSISSSHDFKLPSDPAITSGHEIWQRLENVDCWSTHSHVHARSHFYRNRKAISEENAAMRNRPKRYSIFD